MHILFIGDVVGSLGREALATCVPKLKRKYRPQVTTADGKNVALGQGIIGKIYKKSSWDGVDAVTMGNRTWDNKDISKFTDDTKKMVRPANFPEDVLGQGMVFVKADRLELTVVDLQARAFVVSLEDPFRKVAKLVVIAYKRTPLIFVDSHDETTSEKRVMSWFLDGQVSTVVGTHTHIRINDARILPKGTALLSDVGITGSYDGILGMKYEPIIEKPMTTLPKRSKVVETGRTILFACILEIDDQMGQVKMIEPIQISEDRPFQE